jgi:hypothetical protein
MKTDLFREQTYKIINQQSFSEDFLLPDYQKLNVKNILPHIGTVFGVNPSGQQTFPKDYLTETKGTEKIVLFIFDGLGYNRLLHYIGNHNGIFTELTEKGTLKPLTTVFPSTTSTVLTSIFTGLSPAEHQILGYRMFSQKYGLIFNTLDMKPVYGYNAKVELAKDYTNTIKSSLPNFEQNGVKTTVLTKAAIAGSGLSEIIHRDCRLIPYLLGADMFTQLRKALEHPGHALLLVYYSGVDTLAHKYGPYSDEVTFELATLEHSLWDFVNSLNAETKRKTLMILTADHGVADIHKSYYLKDHQEVMANLMMPPVGDGRAAFLYTKSNQKNTLKSAFEQNITGFKLFPSDELISKGAFGTPTDMEGLKEKVGDFTALSISQSLIAYPFFEDDRFHEQLGAHGGMTMEEMIVPFLSVKLASL